MRNIVNRGTLRTVHLTKIDSRRRTRMPLDYVAASDPQSAHSASEHRRVLVVACGTSPSRMPEPALAALAAADVVFHDANFDPAMLALIPRGAFVEPVSSCGDRVSAQTAAIARADKLAAEGWRVVWLICGSDQPVPGKFAASGDWLISRLRSLESRNASGRGRKTQPAVSGDCVQRPRRVAAYLTRRAAAAIPGRAGRGSHNAGSARRRGLSARG